MIPTGFKHKHWSIVSRSEDVVHLEFVRPVSPCLVTNLTAADLTNLARCGLEIEIPKELRDNKASFQVCHWLPCAAAITNLKRGKGIPHPTLLYLVATEPSLGFECVWFGEVFGIMV